MAPGVLAYGTPQPLFDSVLPSRQDRFTYEPANDGQRFLVSALIVDSKGPISIVLNWQASIAN